MFKKVQEGRRRVKKAEKLVLAPGSTFFNLLAPALAY